MENFFIYLAKSSVLIAVFYFCYYLFLSRETFFKHNRVFQLFGLIIAFVLPFLFITETVFVEPVLYDVIPSAATHTIVQVPQSQSIDWWLILGVGYFAGVSVLFFKLIIQLLSLKRIINKNSCNKLNGFIMVETSEKTSPFSFFNYIVYNPDMYSENDLKTVIAHEKIHASEKHSLDLLLMHLLCIIQWFNPFAWLYKKAVGQNLEYIADQSAAAQLENKKTYQYLLLAQSIATSQNLTIINPFFNSLIKKRIIMLNQKKSKRVNTLKFGLILPFLGLFLFLINTKTVAQTKTSEETTIVTEMKIQVVIDKNTTDDDLASHSKFIKEKDGIDLNFSNIKRNTKGEIIKITSTFQSPSGSRGTYNVNGTEPMKPFSFYYELDADKKIGIIGHGSSENIKTNLKQEFENQPINVQEAKITSSISTINHTDEFGNNVVWNKSDLSNPTNPIFYVDGIEKGPGFDINSIGNIDKFGVLPNEIALKKYGKQSENGIVEITTFPVIQEQSGWQLEKGIAARIIDQGDSYVNLEEFMDDEIKEPIIILDGKNIGKDYKNIKIKYSQLMGIGISPPNKFTSEIYGAIGKNGVIVLETKKEYQASSKWQVSAVKKSDVKDTDEYGYLLLKTLLRSDMTKPIVIVDGKNKGTSLNKIKINTSKIESYGVWPASQDAIERFGKKGKNGVIEIKTKKENQN